MRSSQNLSLRTITYTRKEAIHQAWNVLVDSLFSAAAVKWLSYHGTPLFSVSGRQRSNTLYFACKVCANKVLLAPIGNPAPRGFSPLDTPLFLTAKRYQNHKSRFGIHAVKNGKSEKSPRGGLEKFRIFVHGNLLRICNFPWRSYGWKREESCRPAHCCVYRRFLSTIYLSPIFIADICRLLLSLIFSNASDNAMHSEAKRNKSVIADHQNHYNFVIGGCNLRASRI